MVPAQPGRPFSLAIFGMELSIFDRVRLVGAQTCRNDQKCLALHGASGSPWTIASLFCFTILGIKRVMAVADLGEICVCYEQINGAVMNPNQSLRLPLVVTGLWQAWRPDKAYRKLEEARKDGRTWKVPRRSQGIDRIGRIGRIGQRSRWLDSGAWVPRSTARSSVECPGQRPWMEMETMRQFSYDYYWLLKLLENEWTWHVMNCNQETWL